MNAILHSSNAIHRAIADRTSVNHFEHGRPIPETHVVALVSLATRAPSAFNFQNWRFIAVTSSLGKLRLARVAHGQQKVVDASVTFIICGTLAPYASLAKRLEPCVDARIMDRATAASWVDQACETYGSNPARQRDEAIRSASLAAMTLMLAAQGMGLTSCPMIGFDSDALAREFGLRANELPVMLVAVGYPAAGNWPQKPRRPLSEVMELA